MALYPAGVVSWLVRRRLVREAVEEFAEDYRHFSIPGESKPPGVGRPFMVRGRTRRIGVVLTHGYMAAPLEVKGLADYLGSRGFGYT